LTNELYLLKKIVAYMAIKNKGRCWIKLWMCNLRLCRDVAMLRLYKDLGFGYKNTTKTIHT